MLIKVLIGPKSEPRKGNIVKCTVILGYKFETKKESCKNAQWLFDHSVDYVSIKTP